MAPPPARSKHFLVSTGRSGHTLQVPDSQPSKRRPRRRRNRSNSGSSDPTSQILKLLASQPLNLPELSKKLNQPFEPKGKLADLLQTLESSGKIARIRKDRYIVPQEADLFTGTIQFHPSGAAHILSGNAIHDRCLEALIVEGIAAEPTGGGLRQRVIRCGRKVESISQGMVPESGKGAMSETNHLSRLETAFG